MLLLLLACAHPPTQVPAASGPAPEILGEADANGNPTLLPGDPAAAYAACRERVEGEERDGECAKDADCAPAGCSREVCAPSGADITTMCDVQPCFSLLDRCGCAAGRCTWTLRSAP